MRGGGNRFGSPVPLLRTILLPVPLHLTLPLPLHFTLPLPLHLSASIPRALSWDAATRTLTIIDQRRLPGEVIEIELRSLDGVDEAIRTLAVRGAPAIGVAAALGLVAAFSHQGPPSRDVLLAGIDRLARSRPWRRLRQRHAAFVIRRSGECRRCNVARPMR